MVALAIVMFVVALAVIAGGLVNQRRLWWSMSAWRYRRPEANEPSDEALFVQRIGTVAGGVVFAVVALVLANMGMDAKESRQSTQEFGEAVKAGKYDMFGTAPTPDPEKAEIYDASEVLEKARGAVGSR